MAVSFSVGEEFASVELLGKKIKLYERTNYFNLKRDSRTIDAAIKKKSISLDKVSEEDKIKLKYYELLYTCIHGGRKHKSCSKGLRQSSTFKKGCPFRILLRLSNDGTKLVVSSIINSYQKNQSFLMNFNVLFI